MREEGVRVGEDARGRGHKEGRGSKTKQMCWSQREQGPVNAERRENIY